MQKCKFSLWVKFTCINQSHHATCKSFLQSHCNSSYDICKLTSWLCLACKICANVQMQWTLRLVEPGQPAAHAADLTFTFVIHWQKGHDNQPDRQHGDQSSTQQDQLREATRILSEWAASLKSLPEVSLIPHYVSVCGCGGRPKGRLYRCCQFFVKKGICVFICVQLHTCVLRLCKTFLVLCNHNTEQLTGRTSIIIV